MRELKFLTNVHSDGSLSMFSPDYEGIEVMNSLNCSCFNTLCFLPTMRELKFVDQNKILKISASFLPTMRELKQQWA